MKELSPQVRSAIARQTWIIRKYDTSDDELEYSTWRDYRTYLSNLGGLSATRNYILEYDALPKVMLDVGCGEGRALNELLQNWPEFTVVAATLSPSLIRPNISYDHPRLQLVPRSIERLPGIFPPNHFGLIISVYGLHYCQSALYAVEAIDYLLAPGGILKCVGPCGYRIDTPEISIDCLTRYAELFQNKGYTVQLKDNILFTMKSKGQANSKFAESLCRGDLKSRFV